MSYKEIKEILEQEDYKEVIKAILSFELNVKDENILDNIYDEYIDNDDTYLLSEELYEVKDLIEQTDDCINVRHCSECNKEMWDGFCIDNGMEYYCSNECLHKHYTNEE